METMIESKGKTEEGGVFFQKSETLKIIDRFNNQITKYEGTDEKLDFYLSSSVTMANYMRAQPRTWDQACQFSISTIGPHLINLMENFSEDLIVETFICLYRFLREYEMFLPSGKELSMEAKTIVSGVQSEISGFEGDHKSHMVYASYIMPANIIRTYLGRKEVKNFLDIDKKIDELHAFEKKWSDTIEEKTTSLETIEEKLDEYKTEYNFVGLHQGFSRLLKDKKDEAKNVFRSLIILGVVVLSPLIAGAYLSVFRVSDGVSFDAEYMFTLASVISLEAILIYFFRLVLFNYRSVESQILQLEIRLTLCEFIQSYAGYSKDIKKDDSGALERFENIIFGDLFLNPDKLPNAYEGIDQIGKLIKNISSKG